MNVPKLKKSGVCAYLKKVHRECAKRAVRGNDVTEENITNYTNSFCSWCYLPTCCHLLGNLIIAVKSNSRKLRVENSNRTVFKRLATNEKHTK